MKNIKLLESFTNDICKFIDKKDYLVDTLNKHDELLSSTSIGRVITILAEKSIQINDLDKAYFLVLNNAFLQTLIEDSETLGLKDIISNFTISDGEYNINDFDLNNLNNNQIFLDALSELKSYLDSKLDSKDIERLLNSIKNHFKLNILQIISEQSIVFKKFFNYINSDVHLENVNLLKKDLYYVSLKNEFTTIVFEDKNGMTLKDIYIEPEFKVNKKCFRDNDVRCEVKYYHDDKSFFEHEKDLNLHQYIDDFLNEKNSLDLNICAHEITYIFGYPGQGKSSFCKRFMYDIVTDRNVYAKDIYLLKLRDVRKPKELIDNPYESILKELESNIGITISNFDNSILILDGLDELYMKQGIGSSDVESFCLNIYNEKKQQKIIITSRYGYIDYSKIYRKNVLLLQLGLFDLEKQKQWLKKYKVFHPDSCMTESQLDKFNKELKGKSYYRENKYSHISELINQPILLHMVVSLDIKLDENTNRTSLYEEMFDLLIERKYDTTGQIENLSGLDKEDLRELLQNIAIHIYQSDFEYIRKNELEQIVEPLNKSLSDKLNNDLAFKKTIKGLMIAFYFQETKKVDIDKNHDDASEEYAIEFLHKSLMEYLVAEKIWLEIKEFTYKKNKRKYIIEDAADALKIIWDLSSKKSLSNEVKEHIINFAKIEEDKDLLHERLSYFLDDFFDKQFIGDNSDKDLINGSIHTFYSYWFIISTLEIKKNIITDNLKDKIIKFMKFSMTLYDDAISYDMSYQDFSDKELINFLVGGHKIQNGYMGIGKSKFINVNFENVNFSNCYFGQVDFRDTNFKNTNISNTVMFHCNFENSDFTNSTFLYLDTLRGIDFKDAVLENVKFRNVDLTRFDFSKTKVFKNVVFYECLNINDAKFPNNYVPKNLTEVEYYNNMN